MMQGFWGILMFMVVASPYLLAQPSGPDESKFVIDNSQDNSNFRLFLDRDTIHSASWPEIIAKGQNDNIQPSKQSLSIKPRSLFSDQHPPWIYLDFDHPRPEYLVERAGFFDVLHSSYNSVIFDSVGQSSNSSRHQDFGRAALFQQSDFIDLRSINPTQQSNLDIFGQSFLIHFFIIPGSSRSQMQIMFCGNTYHQNSPGHWQGFKIEVFNQKIYIYLQDILQDQKKRKHSIVIPSSALLNSQKWNRVILHFSKERHGIDLYINNRLISRNSITASGKLHGEKLAIKFPIDSPPIITFGGGFIGYLDELLWFRGQGIEKALQSLLNDGHHTAFYEQSSYNPLQQRHKFAFGELTSAVYDSKIYGSMLHEYSVAVNLGQSYDTGRKPSLPSLPRRQYKESSVRLFVRASNYMFNDESKKPVWQELSLDDPDGHNKHIPLFLLQGRYWQWKIQLYGNADGDYSPEITSVDLFLRNRQPIYQPRDFRVDKAQGQTIKLSWQRPINQPNIGYRIYYGLRADRMDGFIDMINQQRITSHGSQFYEPDGNSERADRIVVSINNDVIAENRKRYQQSLLSYFAYPHIQSHQMFFFQVVAYDLEQMKQDGLGEQLDFYRSPMSKMISVRPY